MPAIRLFRPWA